MSAAGWIKGAPGMLERAELETGRGSWGRDSELDEEPTLLHDSEPKDGGKRGKKKKNPERVRS